MHADIDALGSSECPVCREESIDYTTETVFLQHRKFFSPYTTHKYGPVRAPGKAKCHRRAKVQGRAYEPSSDLIPQSVGALVVQKLFLELGKIICILLKLIKAILGYARTNR